MKKTTNYIKHKLKRKEIKRQIGKLSKSLLFFIVSILIVFTGILVDVNKPEVFSILTDEESKWQPKDVEKEMAL